MIGLDLSLTAHTQSLTGIQQVARALFREWVPHQLARPFVFDPYARLWRDLDRGERHLMEDEQSAGTRRSAHWSHLQKLKSRARRFLPIPDQPFEPVDGWVTPELFSPAIGQAYLHRPPPTQGPRIAIFHDAIALRNPDWCPPATVARYDAYVHELAQAFDGIAAVSEASRLDLLEAWSKRKIQPVPPVQVIGLGVTLPPPMSPEPPRPTEPERPRILMIGSLEYRKNHLSLLDACEQLWSEGFPFRLDLVGMLNRNTGKAAAERIKILARQGLPLHWHGALPQDRVEALYQQCDFTVYPSLYEGFGLPVLESVTRHKPCVTTAAGGLSDVVAGGGCLVVEPTPEAIANGIRRILLEPELLATLKAESSRRPVRPWAVYAKELHEFIASLM